MELSLRSTRRYSKAFYLSFILPLGSTDVTGAIGREDVPEVSCAGALLFLGFFVIFSLRCSLAMVDSSVKPRM